jgi:predicted ArsR family transcriptional regulator
MTTSNEGAADADGVLADASRRQLVDLLGAGPRTAPDLAGACGLHITTVRSHLRKLKAAGLVAEARHHHGPVGRPATLYRLCHPLRSDSAGGYASLVGALVESLAAAGESAAGVAAEAGRRWGAQLAGPRGPLVGPVGPEIADLMDELGFDATLTGAGDIELHRCPMLDLARRHPDIVCALHGAVVDGAADRMGAGPLATTVEPFNAGRCLLRLRPAAPA